MYYWYSSQCFYLVYIDQPQLPSTFELGSKVEHSSTVTPPSIPPRTYRDKMQDQMLLMKNSDNFEDLSESDRKHSDGSLREIVLQKTPSHSVQQTEIATSTEESLHSLPPPRPPKPLR